MAGGVLKGFGITFIVLGSLLLAAGLVAAAYSAYLFQDNEDRGLFADPDREDQSEALLLGAGAAFAAGLVLLILGLVLNGAGNARRHRELLAAAKGAGPAAGAPAPAAQPASRRSGWAVAAVLLALGLAALAAVAALDGGGPASTGGLLGGRQDPLPSQEFDGAVRNAVSVFPAGAWTADGSGSIQEFQAPAGATSLRLQLEWTPADGGAQRLRLILEQDVAGSWIEVGRTAGTGPLALEAEAAEGASLRYRVFPDGDVSAVAEQPFHVRIDFGR